MKMIRACFLFLAVLLPTSWTIAHAEDAPAGDSGGDMKKSSKKAVIAYRKSCKAVGTGLSHYILMDRKAR